MFYCLSEEKTAMILFNLDMKGTVSRGSACQSGSIRASHVLSEMLSDEDLRRPSLRISATIIRRRYRCTMDALKVFKYKICFVTLAPKEILF
jgi:cysteine sulfinate desulfinase/cysteine desulfurase-like protein